MITFIIYDDKKEFRSCCCEVVSKVCFDLDIKSQTLEFNFFNKKFESVINDRNMRKIYILDIELPGSLSGIEIAKKIRKNDWDSTIIIVTTHSELGYEALKAQIMLLDFVCKKGNWQTDLTSDFKKAIKQIDNRKTIIIESNKIMHRIYTDDILYVIKDSVERKCTIKTTYGEVVVSKNITDIGNMLDKRFYLTHRSCYINLDKVRSINWRTNTIYFDNGDSIDYLSRDRKKALKEYVRSN